MPKVSWLSEENNTSNVWLRKSKAFSNTDNLFTMFISILSQHRHGAESEMFSEDCFWSQALSSCLSDLPADQENESF